MKYLTKRWTKNNDGVLYFFQRLQEMLFHYSNDFSRAPIHNSHTLALEYLSVYRETLNGNVKSYQLDKIQEELCDSICKDKILQKHFGIAFVNDIEANIRKNKENIVFYFNNKIPNRTYYDWCVEYIKEYAPQKNCKKEIEFGLKSWIVEIIFHGYSPEYIYTFLCSHIKNCSLTKDPKELLDEFLSHFTLEKKEYHIYLSFNRILAEYKELLEKRLNISFEYDSAAHNFKMYKGDLVGCIAVTHYDYYGAMAKAVEFMDVFIKHYRVLSNYRNEIVRKYGFVKTIDTDETVRIPTRTLGLHAIEPQSKKNFDALIDHIIFSCQKKHPDSYIQLNKMVDLHNSAISQRDLNNGFLNLWSILEIATANALSESKVDKVIEGVLPILKKDYIASLLLDIQQDLEDNLSQADYDELLSKTQIDESDLMAMARFVFLPEYEKLREDYFEKLEGFPVIRTKIYNLYVLKDDKSQLVNILNKYTRRVKWHIYRLYRTRNAIVHSGKKHRRIQMLGEHLHIYVDQILYDLLMKLAFEKTLNTVSDVLVDAKLMCDRIECNFKGTSAVLEPELNVICSNYYFESK